MSQSALVVPPGRRIIGGSAAQRGLVARGWPFALLALAPIVIAAAWRLPIINQLNYADAWFYTGYAFTPSHHFAIFGFNYFAVRFPAILAIGVFERLFGPGDGFVVLRYLLAVGCAWSVFIGLRRVVGVPSAVAAALLLVLNPFFSRMLLWDYSGFMEIAAGVIGFALWYWADDRRLGWTVPAGIALSAAVFSNALIGTALFVLVVVEGVSAVRRGRVAAVRCILRLLVVVASAVGVFAIGYLAYLAILGSLSPSQLLSPTLKFLGSNSQESSPYQIPISTWILREPRVWAPVVVSVALMATMRGRILGADLRARIAQMCVFYTTFLWLYRFAITSSVVETWYAYSVVVVVLAPAIGVLVSELASQEALRARRVWIVVGLFVVASLVIRDVSGPIDSMYRDLQGHRGLDVGLLVLGLAAAAACAVARLRFAGMGLLIVVAAVMFYAPSVLDGRGTTGIFVPSGRQEWNAYRADQRFLDIVSTYDKPQARLFLWWPGTLGDVALTWSDLPQTGDTLNEVGLDQPLSTLTPLGAGRLAQLPVKYIMIVAPRQPQVHRGIATLRRAHVAGNVVAAGRLTRGSLSYAVFQRT